MYGYVGKLLFVNLSDHTTEVKELPEEWAKDFVGGAALGARVLWEYMPKNTPAFDEKSMVGFVSGAFNNTPVFFGARWTACSKSPFNDQWNDANSGGYLGPMIRKAGYDGIFINGIAEKPVYLYIHQGKAEIRDASFMWGKTVPEAEEALYKELGDDQAKYAMIGVCGENMGYAAAVMNDTHRAAARGGTAAVMGSKKLKAVVCSGTGKVDIYDRQELIRINKQIHHKFKTSAATPGFCAQGTSGTNFVQIQNGDAPVRNWGASYEGIGFKPEDAMEFNGDVFNPKYTVEAWGCANCPTRCGAIMDVNEGPWKMKHIARPEYESAGLFAANLMNKDVLVMIRCNELCNLYGADTIAVGGTIGWAMECCSEGVLSPEELDGINLTWGNGQAIVEICEKIVKGEGCGKILMNGSKYASDYFGKGEEYLVVSRNVEPPAHDPRRMPGFARSYFADPTPCRHVKGSLSIAQGAMTPEERFTKTAVTGFQDVIETGRLEFNNNSGICRFGMLLWMDKEIMYSLFPAVTGFEMNDLSWYVMGMRSFTMRHAFNMREGFRRKDYYISPRLIGEPPLPDGDNANHTVDITRAVDNFYNAIGFYQDGMPREDMLKMVGGMDMVYDEFYPAEN